MSFRLSSCFSARLAVSVLGLSCAPVVAQDTAPATSGYNVPSPQPAPNARQAEAAQRRERAKAARESAERARQARKLQLQNRLRDMMSGFGFSDAPTQDAVLEYIENEELARRPVRAQGRKVLNTLRENPLPPELMTEQLAGFKVALEADKARRAQAQADLDARIGWSRNSRLEAMLLVMGVLGEGTTLVPLNAPKTPNEMTRRAPATPGQNLPLTAGERRELMRRFDANGDNRLNEAERGKLREFLRLLQTQQRAGHGAAQPTVQAPQSGHGAPPNGTAPNGEAPDPGALTGEMPDSGALSGDAPDSGGLSIDSSETGTPDSSN